MKKLALLFTFIALLVPLHLAAQSIDFGRGELPVTCLLYTSPSPRDRG